MRSIWNDGVNAPKFGNLEGEESCDVLIVGGGIAGILCAHKMKAAGIDCILLESDSICSHTTAKTTAKITLQHGLIYDKIRDRYGIDGARMYFRAQSAALEEYAAMSERIDFDYEAKSSYVYSTSDREALERELTVLLTLGASAELIDSVDLPIDTVGAVRLNAQAQMHPLKLMYTLASGLRVYEHSPVTKLDRGVAFAKNARINYEKLVIATHFPILNKHGGYFMKMYQHRSYVIALEGARLPSGMYVDGSGDGLSLRSYRNTLLLGGAGHRTGKDGGGFSELRSIARRYYPNSKEVGAWATQDCMTLDGIPYIGRYSSRLSNVYVATGFNKWGMTSAMVAANILTDMILGKKNDFAEIFSPDRSLMHAQLAVNIGESLLGMLTPKAPRCPHMGCALSYNKEEGTWDCPCHGSRFTHDGRVLDAPAIPKDKRGS